MKGLLDTSVLIASLDLDEPAHEACDACLASGVHGIYLHALAETYSILTGGRRARRVDPGTAVQLIEHSVLPFVETVSLTAREVRSALGECRERGVRGGAIYDFLHLCAARKSGAERLYTLDVRHFEALSKPGDPRIETP